MITLQNLPQYYNNFDASKGYKNILFLASRGLQSSELNELQSIAFNNTKIIADSLFKNGSLLKGGGISINGDVASLDEGVIYVNGYSVSIPASHVNFNVTGEAQLGVRVDFTITTDEMDPTLLDPALGTSNYSQPGAYRLRITASWDNVLNPRPEGSEFYSVHTLLDGAIRGQEVLAPELQSTIDILARYDKAANGSYVSEGCQLIYTDFDVDTNLYGFAITAGTANVDGYQLTNQFSRRVVIPGVSEYNSQLAEPLMFQSGVTTYAPRFKNIKKINRIVIVKEETVNITHGNFSGASDMLPRSPVIQLLEVKQGATTYTANTDFILSGDFVSWAPAGAEPVPGSTYSVKYRYQTVLTDYPVDAGYASFQMTGVADNTLMYVDYEYFLSRIDRVMLKADGGIVVMKGAPDYYRPMAPQAPETGLSLATVQFTWGQDPLINLEYTRAYRMKDIAGLQAQLDEMKYNVARLALLDRVRSTDPATNKLNLFVDPLINNNLRDPGIEQDATVEAESLHLPINVTVHELHNSGVRTLLPYTLQDGPKQTQRTKSRKINEFMTAGDIKIPMTVSPANYSYVARSNTVVNWQGWWGWWGWDWWWGWGWWGGSTSSTTTSQIVNEVVGLPQMTLRVSADGFNPNELVDIFFDGIKVATIAANAQGALVNAAITTPATATSGAKVVSMKSKTVGVTASAIFTSIPFSQTTVVTRWGWFGGDPIAETFTLTEGRFLAKVQLMFAVKPTSSVTVDITNTQVGMPVRNQIIAQKILQPNQIALNTPIDVVFDSPVYLERNVEYAIAIESTDAVGELYTAKLGERDKVTLTYVMTQPYAQGVLLNSSNGSTWSPIQDEDLWFTTGLCKFQSSNTAVLGTATVVDSTDAILSVGTTNYPGTFLSFKAVLLDRNNETYTITPGVPIHYQRYSGRIQVSYEMRTTDPNVSPVIDISSQLVSGNVQLEGTYVSRAFDVSGTKLSVRIEEWKETLANVSVFYHRPAVGATPEAWLPLTRNASKVLPANEDFVDAPYEATDLTVTSTQIKVVLSTSSEMQRPRVKNIRAYVMP